jgi:hypothetical protein
MPQKPHILVAGFLLAIFSPLTHAEVAPVTPAPAAPPQSAAELETLKILTVGNSFANDSVAYLEHMAKAAGKKAVIFRANLGGHSLEQHVGYLKAFEADPNDPKGRAYKNQPDPKTGEKRNFSLREALEADKWDFVSIQQVSTHSFKPESYEPFASTLISYIQKYAPEAKIMVLQTWAYRADHTMYKPGQLDGDIMFNGLKMAYSKLAADYHLAIIPAGEAMRQANALPRWNSIAKDPAFDYKNPPAGTLPVQPDSLYLGYYWKKNKKDNTESFILDAKHASKPGRYLLNCVYYNTVFNAEPPPVTAYVPEGVDPKDAEVLRAIAVSTVKNNNIALPALETAQAKLEKAPAKATP